MVLSVLLQAKNNGAIICFDPGPRFDIWLFKLWPAFHPAILIFCQGSCMLM